MLFAVYDGSEKKVGNTAKKYVTMYQNCSKVCPDTFSTRNPVASAL